MSEVQDPSVRDESIAFLQDSILALAREAMEVLRQDLPHFFHREARKRFLASPTFARGLSDDAMRALKADLDRVGPEATERLLARLEDEEPWLAGRMVEEPSGKHFEENPVLWEAVGAICADLEGLLRVHGFPEDAAGGYGVVYQEPRRFVSGHYMPSIAEKYWKRIAELKEAEARQEEVRAERERSELLARWSRF